MGIIWSALIRFVGRKEIRSSRKEDTKTEERSALPDSTSTPVTGNLNQRHIQSANTSDTGSTNEASATDSSRTSQKITIQGNNLGSAIGPIKFLGNTNSFAFNNYSQIPTINSTSLLEPVEFGIQENVPFFIGRDKCIETLHNLLNQKDNGTRSKYFRTVLINGMAGVGKTELVRKYVQLYKKSYFYVLWINAETHLETRGRLLKLAERLSIDKNPEKLTNPDILDKIFDCVCQKPTLIIFDNVESIITDGGKHELDSFLPRTIKTGWILPAIIVTTRNRDWEDVKCIELPVFEAEETLKFLSTLGFNDSDDNQDSITKIRHMCQDLPLGLQQVISFFQRKRQIHASLSKVPYTLNEFWAKVMCNETELLSAKPKEQFGFFKITEKTFEHIVTVEHGPMALRCLLLMATLNPDNIPMEFFDTSMKEALVLLHDFNLVTRCDWFYQIHRMIQEAVKKSAFINNLSDKNSLLQELGNFMFKLLENVDSFAREVKQSILESAVRLNSQLPQVNHALSERCREVIASVQRYPQQVRNSEGTQEIGSLAEEPSESTVRKRRLYSDVLRRTTN